MSDTPDNPDARGQPSGSGTGRRLTSLRQLPQAVEPARDLWPGIESAIRAVQPSAAGAAARARRPVRWQWLASAAAVAAALVLGVLIGRHGPASVSHGGTPLVMGPAALNVAYITDPRYVRERARLLQTFQTRLATLPPATRAKVAASLDTIDRSLRQIQDALGHDPANPLLQELLVDTYQQEMQMLTTVDESAPESRAPATRS